MFNPEHVEIYIEWNILLERKGADINPLETVLPRRDVLLRIGVVVKCQNRSQNRSRCKMSGRRHSTEAQHRRQKAQQILHSSKNCFA